MICLQCFELPVFQFDRRRPAEDVDHDRHAAVLSVDRVDFAFQVLEHPFCDLDPISLVELERQLLGFVGLLFRLLHDLGDVGSGHRRGLAARAGEVADPARLANQEPRVVVQLHVEDDVAGIKLALDDPLLAVLELGNLFDRNDDVAEKVVEPLNPHPTLQRLANRIDEKRGL